MKRKAFAIATAVLVLAPHDGAPARSNAHNAVLSWVQDELRPFSGEAEFRRYMRDVRRAARERGFWWAQTERERRGAIIVTGSRVVPRNASITNVQEAGVDEGDVVKQIGRFLIVLQDGRLFSIDTEAGSGGELALVDRANVYRSVPREDDEEDWYDELLVRGDRIVVTGYSYRRDVSELGVYRLTPDGRFEREGIFQIESGDYYDPNNYSTRLIGDDLVIYTPFNLARPESGRVHFPRVARVEPGAAGWDRVGPARPLADLRSVYGPLTDTFEPVMHSVSVCPLARTDAGRDLRCRTRAFIGPHARNLYVTPEHIYLWIGGADNSFWSAEEPDCPGDHRASFDEVERATVYRIPVGVGDPTGVTVRGAPFDQFSFDESNGALRALVEWRAMGCYRDRDEPVHVSYLSLPLSHFGRHVSEAPPSAFRVLPPTTSSDVANRFTATHLAYAPLNEAEYDEEERDYRRRAIPRASQLRVVPLARPGESRSIPLDHNVRRLEVVGDDLFVSGRTAGSFEGSSLSYIDTEDAPRLASALRLDRRFDGEGRSHAFNLSLAPDGSALFGLPTYAHVPAPSDEAWWSLPSDLSFFSLDPQGRMRPAGTLASAMPRLLGSDDSEEHLLDGEPDRDAIPGYSCEVSCVDWYGNSRPIFTGGRIFALSATELIEGRLEGGRIVEVQRLDFARSRPRGN